MRPSLLKTNSLLNNPNLVNDVNGGIIKIVLESWIVIRVTIKIRRNKFDDSKNLRNLKLMGRCIVIPITKLSFDKKIMGQI